MQTQQLEAQKEQAAQAAKAAAAAPKPADKAKPKGNK
jgi:hypothetical protein